MNYDKLEKALVNLKLQFQNYQTPKPRDVLDQEAIEESVIQRFEICYDLLWKNLKRHMTEVLGLSGTPNSPKPVLRIAYENNLLPSAECLERWITYAAIRVETAHIYSKEVKQRALDHMDGFITDAVRVYEAITGTKWQQ